MQFSALLVLCEANICRSPLAESMLRSLTALEIDSAGLTANLGNEADQVFLKMAACVGLDLSKHRSKPVDRHLLANNDLTLVMTSDHKRRLSERYPEFSGKIMLLGHWTDGGISISDPHQKSKEAYDQVFTQIQRSCEYWASKL